MLEKLGEFVRPLPPVVFFTLAVVATMAALLCTIRLYWVLKEPASFKRGTVAKRSTAFALMASLAIVLWLSGCGAVKNQQADTTPPDDPPVTDAADMDTADVADPAALSAVTDPADVEPEPEPEPLAAVSLTQRQIDAFAANCGFSNELDFSSLSENDQARIAATAKYGTPVETALAFPIEPVMERLDDWLAGKLSDEEINSLIATARTTVEESIWRNPVVGAGWFLTLNDDPLATTNNPWIPEFVEKMAGYLAINQDEGITDEEILSNLASGMKPAGLDFCVAKVGDTWETNKWYQSYAARMITLLRTFSFTGELTTKTSIRNASNNCAGSDALRWATLSSTQENEPALKLVQRQKLLNGKEQIVIFLGVNPKDQRPLAYDPKAKDPTPVEPVEPKEPPKTPSTPKTPEPEPQLPKETKVALTYVHKLRGTGEILRDNVTHKGLKPGTTDTYNVPKLEGYIREQEKVTTKVPNQNDTVDVWYTLDVPDEYPLTIDYVFAYSEDGTTAAPSYFDYYAEGSWYSVPSPDIKGYEPDLKIVEDTMPGRAVHVTVKYYPIKYSVVVEHWNTATQQKMVELRDHTETVLHNRPFYYVAPYVPEYTHTPHVISKTIDGNTLLFTVWYTPTAPDVPDKPDIPDKPDKPDKPDGGGGKDPWEDPENTGDAPIDGGDNLPGDKTGEDQNDDKKPPLEDMQDPPPKQDEGSSPPPVEDPDDGFTDNGDPPPSEPDPIDPGTTITDPGTGEIVKPGGDGGPVNDGYIPDP